MSSTWMGIASLAALVLWSCLTFLVGRGFGPVRAAKPHAGLWGDVLPALAATLAGLGLTLL